MHPNLLSVANIFRSRTEGSNVPAKNQTATLRSSRYSIDRVDSHATGSSANTSSASIDHESDESAYTHRPPPPMDTQQPVADDDSTSQQSRQQQQQQQQTQQRPPSPPSPSLSSIRSSLLHGHFPRLSEDGSRPQIPPKRKRRFSFPLPLPWIFKDNDTPPAPASLDFVIESPPVLFHLDPERSTGALVSGQVLLDVKEDSIEVSEVKASLVLRIVQKKPFQGHCDDCTTHEEELQQWSFLTQPLTLSRGTKL